MLEAYSTGEFTVTACCEATELALREGALGAGLEDRPVWREAFRRAGLEVRAVWDEDPGMLADYGLELEPIEQAEAFRFVDLHHRHLDPPVGWRWGHALRGQRGIVGVAIVGNPTGRWRHPEELVEVTRCAVRELHPKGLTWNACSMLYGAAAREAKRRGYQRIITYTRQDEQGASLRASGFTVTGKVRARHWGCASRPRAEGELIPKLRWERQLAPRREPCLTS